MMLWAIFLLMIVTVLAFLLLPLLREQTRMPERADYDSAIYRDQLAEVARDVERGLLTEDQADDAKIEIYKRSMATEIADYKSELAKDSRRSKLILALVALIVLPLGSFAIYSYLGSPELPGRPFAGRQHDPEFVVAREAKNLAAELNTKPDAKGYERLGDMYYAIHDYDNAVAAYQKSLKIDGKNSNLWSGLGDVMVLSQSGMIGPEARDAFINALKLDPRDPRANFYLGLSEMQIGEAQKAVAIWKQVVKDSPPDASWVPMVKEHIELASKQGGFDPSAITPEPPSLTAMPDAAEIMGMNATDQNAMIHKMVDRLAAELKANPNNLEGWERLAKSYRVLGEADKAAEAESKIKELKAKGGMP